MPIGQVYSKYIKHPPVNTWVWVDGDSIDSGTAHLVHNNLSYLSKVNCRHLGAQLGPGIVPLFLVGTTSPFDGIADVPIVDGGIPWDFPRMCMRFGPTPLAAVDYSTDPAGYKPRKIGVQVQGSRQSRPTGTFSLTVAVTVGPVSPAEQLPVTLGTFAPAIGAFDTYTEFSMAVVLRAARYMQSRPSATLAAYGSTITDLYVWVGWLAQDTVSVATPGDSVYCASVWELS